MTTALSGSPITSTLPAPQTNALGVVLQEALADLIDLSLVAKQAHWNVIGRNFRELHLQLDELVDSARNFSDDVAERAAALGISPDGRAATVASAAAAFPSGYLPDQQVVELISARLDAVVDRLRGHMVAAGTADPVTEDLFIGIIAELEKARWMFRAQLVG
ncbi:DNA starvation/stationary phase protection protein [Nocardia sp. 2]|uniref:DNA starvation/stationary phase protection protein n=1 Tax=Nocardia acididurans TaxID=2802282 RepID=A0ABS1MCI3_9NOCA|nr:DNA starvation/stationary phase protection protein [Nocardia acididurans]MBL1078292.1 DNA starvation/stationary phase protection protein [Nocardia acididurans]